MNNNHDNNNYNDDDDIHTKISYTSGVSLSALFTKILKQLSSVHSDNDDDLLASMSAFENGDREYILAKSLLMNDTQSAFHGAWKSRSRCIL